MFGPQPFRARIVHTFYPWLDWILRCGTAVILAFAIYSAGRLAYADWLSRGATAASRERAVRLAALPAFYQRLAEIRAERGGNPVPELEAAARLEPENPERWLRLASAAEFQGDPALAGRSLRRAAALSRLYQPRYLLAQYFFRQQDLPAFSKWSQEAFQMAYGDIAPLLDLCRRMQPSDEAFVRQALLAPPRLRRQFLEFLVRREESEAATPLAEILSGQASAEDLPALSGFCNLVLAQGKPSAAIAVWNDLCQRQLVPYHVLEARRPVTNGDLRQPPLGAGFDWHIEPPPGIQIQQLPGEWRAWFSGSQPESCHFAWQYVPLAPGRQYRLQLDIQPADGASPEGIGWALFYPASNGRWTEGMAESGGRFTARAPLARLALIYRRPLGSPRLTGMVAFRGVRLEMAE